MAQKHAAVKNREHRQSRHESEREGQRFIPGSYSGLAVCSGAASSSLLGSDPYPLHEDKVSFVVGRQSVFTSYLL